MVFRWRSWKRLSVNFDLNHRVKRFMPLYPEVERHFDVPVTRFTFCDGDTITRLGV